jgi:hypothetical protein
MRVGQIYVHRPTGQRHKFVMWYQERDYEGGRHLAITIQDTLLCEFASTFSWIGTRDEFRKTFEPAKR